MYLVSADPHRSRFYSVYHYFSEYLDYLNPLDMMFGLQRLGGPRFGFLGDDSSNDSDNDGAVGIPFWE